MKKLVALFAVMFGFAGTAMAADGYYAGASVGHAQTSHRNFDATRADGSSATVFGGYQLTPSVSAEVAYTRFQNLKAEGLTLKPEMLSVQAVAKTTVLPDTAVFAKGGLAATHLRGDVNKHHFDPVVAVGAEYAIDKHFAVQGEVQYVHDFAGTSMHMTNTSVGVKYTY